MPTLNTKYYTNTKHLLEWISIRMWRSSPGKFIFVLDVETKRIYPKPAKVSSAKKNVHIREKYQSRSSAKCYFCETFQNFSSAKFFVIGEKKDFCEIKRFLSAKVPTSKIVFQRIRKIQKVKIFLNPNNWCLYNNFF